MENLKTSHASAPTPPAASAPTPLAQVIPLPQEAPAAAPAAQPAVAAPVPQPETAPVAAPVQPQTSDEELMKEFAAAVEAQKAETAALPPKDEKAADAELVNQFEDFVKKKES